MKMMKTNREWINVIGDNDCKLALFWSTDLRKCNFKQGTIVLFLGKKDRRLDGNKYKDKIYGYGIYDSYIIDSIKNLWETYEISLGRNSYTELKEAIGSNGETMISCKVLKDVVIFDKPILLEDLEIVVGNGVQTGRNLTDEEEIKMLPFINREKQYEINKEEIEEIKEEKKYYEGKRKKVTTTSMKVVRNSQLAKDYKEYSKEQHNGKCVCEICELEHDERMVDVHHKIQVSDYEKERKEYSTFEDVILLCPLCHRATHVYDGIEGAKEYFKKTIDKR